MLIRGALRGGSKTRVLAAEQAAASPSGAAPYADLEGWQRARVSGVALALDKRRSD